MDDRNERRILQDAVTLHKELSDRYTHFASECEDQARMELLMKFACEEQTMRFELSGEMKKRGWCDGEKQSDTDMSKILKVETE